MKSHKKFHPAFTIVELLIVVVVIAILAAITIVAYNGITNQAKDSALKTDLATAAKKVGIIQAETGTYPTSAPADVPATIQYSQTNAGQGFCATANKDGKTYSITQDGTIQTGPCADHSPIAGTMQSFTQSQCQALPVYTGSNNTAVIALTDSRGGTTRTYQVAKLADNKCWMLNNLKLGSTSSTITLTPQDTNVAASFTLPQLITTGTSSYDDPQVAGPVPGDTGSGATNYGYLYNWPAATAGESRTTMPAGSGDTQYSICPANWRLPSGGAWSAATNEFSHLNARMAGLSGVTDPGYTSSNYYGATFHPNWQPTGPFKGAFSGGWWSGSFSVQGSYAYLWSRSAHASSANDAHIAYFYAGSVLPGNYSNRVYGLGVRCLLN